MVHVGRKRERRHVGRRRGKVHEVAGHIEWEQGAPEDVRRFEIIQMHNPESKNAKIIEGINHRYTLRATENDLDLGEFSTIGEAKLWGQKRGYTVKKAVVGDWIGGGATHYKEIDV